MDDYAQTLLSQLISLPSHEEEQFPAIQKVVQEAMEEVGLAVTLDPESGCLVGTLSVAPEAKTLLLSAHYDTVRPTDAWTKDPFQAELQDGQLYGLGSSDCKGGIVTLLDAIRRSTPVHNLLVIITGYEDTKKIIDGRGYYGSYLLSQKQELKADLGIVTEATVRDDKFAFIKGMFGKIAFRLIAKGKQSHACHPEQGINAIDRALSALEQLRSQLTLEEYAHNGQILQETFNVGIISGGKSINVVPAECQIEAEYRFSPAKKLDQVQEQFENLLKSLEGVDYQIIFANPSFVVEAENPFLAAVQPLLGYEPETRLSRGGTDANTFSGLCGIPCFIFGPGDCDIIHQADEYISLEHLEKCTECLIRILETPL